MAKPSREVRLVWGDSMRQSERASVHEPPMPTQEEARALLLEAAVRQHHGQEPTQYEIDQIRRALNWHRPLSKPLNVPRPVVYYFRVGDRIKIGYSVNLEIRIRDLMPEEVLGWEPGSPQLERQRHRQFRQHRTVREWFEDCPAIRRHIEDHCQRHS